MAKYTDKQIAEIFIQSLEEAKDTAKKNEKLTKEIETSLDSFLYKLENTKLSIDDTQAKQTIAFFQKVSEDNQKGIKLTRYAYGLIFAAVLVLGISFYFTYLQIKTKSEIREEYRQELLKKELLIGEQDAAFYKRFWQWVEKNPQDWQTFRNKVENQK